MVRSDGRALRLAISCVAVIAALLAGCDHATTPTTREHTCSGAQAISAADLHGASLPSKTLALTFDDGPGPRTAELSTYLKSQGIRAGFFVNGKMIGRGGAVLLQQLISDGHVIGNHTQTHASLTGRSTGGAHLGATETVAELTQTDALIAPFVPASRFMFRAPYGDYDGVSAAALNASPMKKYVGPINWDIGDHMGPRQAVDWDCWQPGSDGLVLTVAQCSDLYLKEIDSVGHGVVLMHDPYFIGGDPMKGGTVDMVKLMVPSLKAKGFTFVRIDEVPDVAQLLPALPVEDDGGATGAAASSDSTANTASSGGSSSGTITITMATAAPTPPPQSDSARGGKPDPCPPSPQQDRTK